MTYVLVSSVSGALLALMALVGGAIGPVRKDAPAPALPPGWQATNEPAGYVALWTENFADPRVSPHGRKHQKKYGHTLEDGAFEPETGNPNLIQITPKGSTPKPFGDAFPGSLPDPLAEARAGSEDGYVAAIQVPYGWKDGRKGSGAPGTWVAPLGGRASIYTRFRFKLSSNYVHWIGSKIGYFRADGERANSPVFIGLSAQGTYSTQLNAINRPVKVNVGLQGVVPPSTGPQAGKVTWNAKPNLGTPNQWLLARGKWQTIEVQLVGNTPGRPDGIVRLWLNGVKIIEYNDCGFFGGGVAPKATGWANWRWTPTHDSFDKDGFDFSVYQVMDQMYVSAPPK